MSTPDPKANAPAHGPNCWDCGHFTITWDPRMPYGCKRMGFRSKTLPSLEVLRCDGRACGGFLPKAVTDKPSDRPVDGPTTRRESDLFRPSMSINLIT